MQLRFSKFILLAPIACLVVILTGMSAVAAFEVEQAKLATPAQVKQAVEVFKNWTSSYQQKNYKDQFKLVHPRLRKWSDKESWKRWMKRNQRKIGALKSYEIVAIAPITPEQVPCTEMGHCYRKGMQVVIVILNSVYGKIGGPRKEYAVMTNSPQGWRFGGGTVLNRPFGETLMVLDRKDERRYQFKGLDTFN